MEVTAKLSKVRLERVPDAKSINGFCIVAYGLIWEDTRGRFIDGTEVHTSRVTGLTDGCIITQNSVYKII